MASGWEVSGAAPPPLSAYTHCGYLVSGMTSIMEVACVPWDSTIAKYVHQKVGWLPVLQVRSDAG